MPSPSAPGSRWSRRLAGAMLCTGLACGAADPPGGSTADAAEPVGGAPAPPRETVVSLSLPASHFIVALGAQSLLVGVDAASAGIPELAGLPVIDDPADAADLAPDLVLLPAAPPIDDPALVALRARGIASIPFAPHDLEDVMELVREVGARLAGEARAEAFAYRLTRPLAAIAGASFGRPRPRVLAVVGLDPLRVAGGHSFETDLIEIAGGRSITHEGEEPRLELGPGSWRRLAPDLVLVVTSEAPDATWRARALESLPLDVPIAFYTLDPELFWLRDPLEPARRLQALIEPVAGRMQPPAPTHP